MAGKGDSDVTVCGPIVERHVVRGIAMSDEAGALGLKGRGGQGDMSLLQSMRDKLLSILLFALSHFVGSNCAYNRLFQFLFLDMNGFVCELHAVGTNPMILYLKITRRRTTDPN